MIGSKSKQIFGLFLFVSLATATIYMWIHYSHSKPQKVPSDPADEDLNPPDVAVPPGPSETKMGVYRQAAIVSNGEPCSKIGTDILLKNGNAVEAAIATLLCDGVTCMQSMGIGGGFLMTIYSREKKQAVVLNARETAPSAATEGMFNGNSYASKIGARSAAVPAELKGYQAAFEKFGSGNLKWADLFEPTIKLCEEGFNVSRHMERHLKRYEPDIRLSESLSKVLMRKDGTLPKLGDLVKRPALAQTLRLIANSPRRAEELYNGNLTDAFIQDIQDNGGIITKEDLLNYQVRWEDPIKAEFSDGKTLYTVPTPGSGPLMAFMLQTLDGFLDNGGLDHKNVHRIVETFKHAYGRRSELGDPYFTNITQLLNDLRSPEYIQRIRESIHDGVTSSNYSYYGAKFNLTEDHGTANLVVLSPTGDAVSVTSTVNLVFGSKFVSRSTGILLNNEMDDFSDPNITNFFGIPPSPANYIRPGKRPMSSMCPAVVVNPDGSVRLVVGSAGGTKITTSTAMVAMLNLWFNKTIKEAIDEPRIHHQLFPMQVSYEFGTTKDIVKGLRKIGHKTAREPRGSGVTGIAVTEGKIYANCDKSKYGNHHGF
ncbi:glutathione hydrolase 1 proenzyme [Nilaparvata lugens]|uniref:glutathione hydrolase 1 proenzyme n=1 Tax=Nilaparvata lugens TaxID=108931 RepID=UPI00193E1F61|nr:glutathione hydrolase 1 proenzyme [Nilaparvata lugens]XP_039292331.1 glutathione hydrolase 1 proenzyme [Nilaparvata lugens]